MDTNMGSDQFWQNDDPQTEPEWMKFLNFDKEWNAAESASKAEANDEQSSTSSEAAPSGETQAPVRLSELLATLPPRESKQPADAEQSSEPERDDWFDEPETDMGFDTWKPFGPSQDENLPPEWVKGFNDWSAQNVAADAAERKSAREEAEKVKKAKTKADEEKLKKDIEEREKQLAELEQKMKEMSAKMMALHAEAKDKGDKLKTLDAEAKDKGAKIKTLDAELVTQEVTIKSNKESIEEADRTLQKKQDGISQARAILDGLKQDFEREKGKMMIAKEAQAVLHTSQPQQPVMPLQPMAPHQFAMPQQPLAPQQPVVPQQFLGFGQPVAPQQTWDASQSMMPSNMDFQTQVPSGWDAGQFGDLTPFLTPDCFSQQQPIQNFGLASQPSAVTLTGDNHVNQQMQSQPQPANPAAKRKREETEETDGATRARGKHKKPRAPRRKPGPRKFESSE